MEVSPVWSWGQQDFFPTLQKPFSQTCLRLFSASLAQQCSFVANYPSFEKLFTGCVLVSDSQSLFSAILLLFLFFIPLI